MLDVLIRNATLVDGTGAPARRADVGVRAGRVVTIAAPGTVDEGATSTIDASTTTHSCAGIRTPRPRTSTASRR
jgi:N-acyl-D-aspartate/D-glutamate deacylase